MHGMNFRIFPPQLPAFVYSLRVWLNPASIHRRESVPFARIVSEVSRDKKHTAYLTGFQENIVAEDVLLRNSAKTIPAALNRKLPVITSGVHTRAIQIRMCTAIITTELITRPREGAPRYDKQV